MAKKKKTESEKIQEEVMALTKKSLKIIKRMMGSKDLKERTAGLNLFLKIPKTYLSLIEKQETVQNPEPAQLRPSMKEIREKNKKKKI